MKRELGIARCGLACCLCSENDKCQGCNSGNCPDKDWCENRKCSILKGLEHCYMCDENCRKGLLNKIKPYAFSLFAKKYGENQLLDCLERNEKNGIVYHRQGISGDYDDFDDVGELIHFIKNGKRKTNFSTITACGECCTNCKKKINSLCKGCIEEDGYVQEWAKAGRCKIHACARNHNVQFCGLCSEFPCDNISKLIYWNSNIIEHMSALRDDYGENL